LARRGLADEQVIMYHGTPEHRAELRASKLQAPSGSGAMTGGGGRKGGRKSTGSYKSGSNTTASFPIVVTTYEMCIRDRQYLSHYLWKYIVVDEGHRLKNLDCK
jgi:ATP-dependent DNA helicase